jgi:hypothetical protein
MPASVQRAHAWRSLVNIEENKRKEKNQKENN